MSYEKKVNNLAREKLLIDEKIEKCRLPIRHYEKKLRTAMDFLENPHNFWALGKLANKHAVLNGILGEIIMGTRQRT